MAPLRALGTGSRQKRHTQNEGKGKWRLLVNTSALVNEEESKADSPQRRRPEVSEAAQGPESDFSQRGNMQSCRQAIREGLLEASEKAGTVLRGITSSSLLFLSCLECESGA